MTLSTARGFNYKASQYDKNSELQKVIAEHLVLLIKDHKFNNPQILDIGCGTGYVAEFCQKYLSVNKGQIYQIDSSEQMCKIASVKARVGQLDFDKLDIASLNCCFGKNFEDFNIITSSMALQWSLDIVALFNNIHKLLRKGGLFAFAVPLDSSFAEVKNALRSINICHQGYIKKLLLGKDTFDSLASLGFEVKYQELSLKIDYENLFAFFKKLNGFGGKDFGLQSRFSDLKSIYRQKNKIETTWNLGLFLCTK